MWKFAEAETVFQGLKLAFDLGLFPLIVELDSLNVVSLIEGSLHSQKEISWLVSEIKSFMTHRPPIMVKYVPRSCITVAHILAKLAFSSPDETIWIEECPAEIADLL